MWSRAVSCLPHTPSKWELAPGLADRPRMDPRLGMEIGAVGEGLGLSRKCPHNQAWLCCRQEQEKEEEEEGTCLTAAGQWNLLEAPSLREGDIPRCPFPSRCRGALVGERGLGGGQESPELPWRGAGQGRDPLSSRPAGLAIGSSGAGGDRALPEGGRGYRKGWAGGCEGIGSNPERGQGYAGKGL